MTTPAEERAEREGTPVIALTTFDLMHVASGHPIMDTTLDGTIVLIRLATADEVIAQQEEASASLPLGGPPTMSRLQAEQRVRPLVDVNQVMEAIESLDPDASLKRAKNRSRTWFVDANVGVTTGYFDHHPISVGDTPEAALRHWWAQYVTELPPGHRVKVSHGRVGFYRWDGRQFAAV